MKNRCYTSSSINLSSKEYKRSRDESDCYEYSYGLSKRQNAIVDDIEAVAEEMHLAGKMARANMYGITGYGKQYSSLPNIYSTPTKFDVAFNDTSLDVTQRSKYNKEKMIVSKYLTSSTSKVYPNPFESDNQANAQPKTDYDYCKRKCHTSDGLVGLKNLGNTCFMNSILQCLLHSDKLVRFFTQPIDNINICTKSPLKGKLTESFTRLCQGFYNQDNHQSFIEPIDVKKMISKLVARFDGFDQQDAHELLRFLLDGLNDEIKSPWLLTEPMTLSDDELAKLTPWKQGEYFWSRHLFINSSFITDSFCGQFRSTITCTICGGSKYCFDPFMDLSLPIPNNSICNNLQRKFRHSSTHQQSAECTLRMCLETFFHGEALSNDDKIDCDRCKKRQHCTKSLEIENAPPILVIHFKRFNNSRRKKNTVVSFPLFGLDFSTFLSSDAQNATPVMYDLFAICHHSGTLHSGHYIA